MVVAIALLRGINVGGRNKIGMEALRDICRGLGGVDVRTWLQSGNVVFRMSRRELRGFGPRLEQAVSEKFAFRPAVMVRTAEELEEAAGANPLAGRAGLDPARLVVLFLSGEPGKAACAAVGALSCASEEIMMGKREVYAYFHQGFARPAVTAAAMEKAAGCAGTARNWNTVQKLLAMTREPG